MKGKKTINYLNLIICFWCSNPQQVYLIMDGVIKLYFILKIWINWSFKANDNRKEHSFILQAKNSSNEIIIFISFDSYQDRVIMHVCCLFIFMFCYCCCCCFCCFGCFVSGEEGQFKTMSHKKWSKLSYQQFCHTNILTFLPTLRHNWKPPMTFSQT